MASPKGSKPSSEKDPANQVHEQAILVETIRKEQRSQKLFENFVVNPHRCRQPVTGKPNDPYEFENIDIESTEQLMKVFSRNDLEPTKKYDDPQTSNQEYGWVSEPLHYTEKGDRRLNYHMCSSEMTKYMDEVWKREKYNLEKPEAKPK